MGPKISVVIPVYKVEPYIRKCLDSVVGQTYRNLEIILIDDGSPDHCGAICDEYAGKDDRIRVIHKKNAGVGAARNDGIQAADGEWIAFMDSDDWYELDHFSQLVAAIPEQQVDVICMSGHIAENRDETVVCRIFAPQNAGERIDKQTLINKTLIPGYEITDENFSCLSFPWNKLFRLSFLKEGQLRFDLSLHPYEDILFNLKVFEKTDAVIACDCIGYHYRTNVETASMNRFNPNWPDMRERFIKELKAFIARQPDKDAYHDAINVRMLKLLLLNLRLYFLHQDNPKPYAELAKEFREMKKEPCFRSAIWGKSATHLRKNDRIKIYLVRLPWFWPIYTMQRTYNRLIKRK